jgi:hypothetical protein
VAADYPENAPAAVIVRSRSDLAQRLAIWPGNTADTTWGFVVMSVVPTAGELAAAREAGRLCDVVAAVRLPADGKLSAPLAPNFAQVIRAAGVDVVWIPKDITGPVRVNLGVEQGLGADETLSTLLMQAVMAVLPTLAVASRADLHTVRALRNLQAGLGDLFSLRLV